MRSFVRIVCPDFHGAHIDWRAANAFLRDVKALDPEEGVFLGDGVDCGGTFSTHQRNYTNELTESYEDDIAHAKRFTHKFLNAAPRLRRRKWLEGNHEAHVERWASRIFLHKKDADALLKSFAPATMLGLKKLDFDYIRRSEHYDGISIPGTIRLGKCFFVHGISHSKHAASVHLARFGASVVFGHVHRSQSVIERTVTSNGFGAWCPGTLSKLQPLYKHTEPSSWSHGYAVQFVNASGNFLHVNVPILDGVSMLAEAIKLAA